MKRLLLLFCLLSTFGVQGFAEETIDSRKSDFRISTLPGLQSNNLEGTGFTASNGPSTGSGIGVGLGWQQANSSVQLSYQSSSYKVTTPTGITPTQVTSTFERGLINFSRAGAEAAQDLNYGLGFEYRSRRTDETSPNVLMSNNVLAGPRLEVSYIKSLDQVIRYSAGVGLFVPIFMEEFGTKTGSYRFSFNPDLALGLIYQVNHFIDFSAGVQAFYSTVAYSGTGGRGVTNALETTVNVFVPLELRFRF